jgi:cell division protein FtsZ
MSVRKRVLVGVGNAGVTLADLLAVTRPGVSDLLAVNNDEESLGSCVAPSSILLPSGDPGEALASVSERFGVALDGAGALFLFGALGGETGSYFLPGLAEQAKARGIPVYCCVGIPFSFEGSERRQRSRVALDRLRSFCEALAVIEYDRLSGSGGATAGVGEAFRIADDVMLSALRAIEGMEATTGPVRITRGDLQAVLGPNSGKTHFGVGIASGENRLHKALEKAMKSPLLAVSGKPGGLKQAKRILLLLKGGRDLSFAEVQTAVAEIERNAASGCQIKTGVDAAGGEGMPLEILLFAAAEESVPATPPEPVSRATSMDSPDSKPEKVQTSPGKPLPKAAVKPAPAKPTQGTLSLETNPRGRFDKSEPTIVEGEDLDVPTFLRKGVKLAAPHRK